jgi:uncharacterized protein (DUF924 family)/TolB-like protein
MADVFVSYSRSDRARVAPLVAAIEAQGWSVWWDPVISPGQEFDVEIAAELKIAAAVLVVCTPQSVTSRWVRGEARDGAERGVLIPVRFGGAELPIDVRALHTIDLDQWKDDRHPQIQEMLRTVRAVIARSRGLAPAQVNSAAAQAPGHGDAARIQICVLPFSNMSGDPAQEYFSDGITEDIITELSRWRLLAVRSRSASFRHRGPGVDIKQVARDLNVHFVVEGSVRRMGERIRISAQLIDAQTGSHVWSERFDRQLDQIFALQDRVVQTIVSTLVGRVQASDVERSSRKPPASLAAYECVLRANALSWDAPDGIAQGIRLVEKAIELDPAYGFAHALLASLRQSEWSEDREQSDASLDEAYALAMRAVALDDGESTCHAILGHICIRRQSHDLAVQYAQRAVEINPNNQWNAADLGAILVYAGHSEEALSWFARAREIDPYFDPPWYWRAIALAYMSLQRYEEALSSLSHARVSTHRYVALIAGCHARLGDMQRATASAGECLRIRPDFSIARFMRKEPYKIPADAERLESSLALAGLPGDSVEPEWVSQVLRFWFEELGPSGWYAKRDAIDARIRADFLSLHERIMAQDGFNASTPRALLAAVIVLDQFSRNLFRGTPRAFAADSVARQLSATAIKQGFDLAMPEEERHFLYLPFEHSEHPDDQALSVELIGRLGNAEWTNYAVAHKAVIDQFGRFPHRNAILNRPSSESEIALLKNPKDWFL